MSRTILKRKPNEIGQWVKSQLQTQARELQQAADSPFFLAAAFALGTLTSFLPVPILDSLLAVGLAAKFARLNKAAIFLARMVWNDLLVVPLYAPGFKLGQWVLASWLSEGTGEIPIQPHLLLLFSFILGAMVLAVGAAISGFTAVWVITNAYRSRVLRMIWGHRLFHLSSCEME
ncbi:MAG: DUF2062 domain-containing protein [Candidatus Promineifilaceae bacterium]|nr:DUF2062 domain-containing protein [Candidatus Promineifilaceae bacterium]